IDFWGGLMDWITTTLVGKGAIREEEVKLLTLVDSIDETIEIIADNYMNTYS
ncbi:TIGR00730 family Rossman fold protein, partial [Francisella tularensis subsp. holarctica]|nr:TIGR00730 family Rossman fold protein [Francisella tularensis subsp. holarctica]